MKKKFLPIMSVLAAMMLVGCGGSGNSSSQQGKSSVSQTSVVDNSSTESKDSKSQESKSQESKSEESKSQESKSEDSQGTSSEAPAKVMNVTSAVLEVKDNKVYIKIAGTAENFAANEFKFAWGLSSETGFVYGSQEPADADYKEAATLNAGAFEASICVTDIAGVVASNLTIYAGPKDAYGVLNVDVAQTRVKDTKFNYYLRRDSGSGAMICVEEFAPIEINEANIYEEEGQVWVSIGGDATVTEADVSSWTPHIDFQRTKGGYSTVRINNDDMRWNFKTTGKAYLECKVPSQWAIGEGWMTHLDFKQDKGTNCCPSVNMDKEVKIGARLYKIHYDPSDTSEANFYGCLGFFIEENPDFVAQFNNDAVKTGVNSAGKTVRQYTSDDGSTQRIAIAATDCSAKNSVKEEKNGTIKLNKGGSLVYNVNCDLPATSSWMGSQPTYQKATLIVGDKPGSDAHTQRHLWNDALPAPEGAPEGTVGNNTGNNPDGETEAAWRLGIKVNDEEVAITNYASLKENGLSANNLGYIWLCEITLKDGDNKIEITQNQIGYSFVFGGDVRLEYKGSKVIVNDYVAQPAE